MIKQVEEIPLSGAAKKRSYREQIRNDIQEAIDNHIEKFEFLGDYNWKYLAGYAREEADGLWRDAYFSIMREARKKYGLQTSIYPAYQYKHEYIRIFSTKMDDRIHVYCQIDFDAPERICGKIIEELIAEKEAKDKAIESKDTEISIDDVGLSHRTWSCLRRAGINKMKDLEGKTETDLMKIRNMGKKGVEEVAAMMGKFGMEVRSK